MLNHLDFIIENTMVVDLDNIWRIITKYKHQLCVITSLATWKNDFILSG